MRLVGMSGIAGVGVLALLTGCASEMAAPMPGKPRSAESAPADADAAKLLNAERSRAGLSLVTRSDGLVAAAITHAEDMSAAGNFSHVGTGGFSVGDRVKAQGYSYCLVAENIAQGQTNAAEAIDSWMKSAGHRNRILNPATREFGMASAPGSYWVLVLAQPGC